MPSGKTALPIGAAIATRIRSIVKAGGNPLDGIGPEDAEGGRRYRQQSTTLASDVQLYVPGWGEVLDGVPPVASTAAEKTIIAVFCTSPGV